MNFLADASFDFRLVRAMRTAGYDRMILSSTLSDAFKPSVVVYSVVVYIVAHCVNCFNLSSRHTQSIAQVSRLPEVNEITFDDILMVYLCHYFLVHWE